MTSITGEELRALIEPGRVNRRLYTDPEIFDARAGAHFRPAWIYVGHESQVKNPGDYFRDPHRAEAARAGARTPTARFSVMHNQCAHRGAHGGGGRARAHASEFRCCYHGWTYHTDGRLKAAPLLQRLSAPASTRPIPRLAMLPVARRRELPRLRLRQPGAATGRASQDFLGHMTHVLRRHGRPRARRRDRGGGRRLQASPITATGSSISKICATRRIRSSSTNPRSRRRAQQSDNVHSDGSGEIAMRQMRQNGAPYSFWETQVGIWTYPNGHSYLGDYHDDAKLVAAHERSGVPRLHRGARSEAGARARPRRSSRCGAGTATSIPTSPS